MHLKLLPPSASLSYELAVQKKRVIDLQRGCIKLQRAVLNKKPIALQTWLGDMTRAKKRVKQT